MDLNAIKSQVRTDAGVTDEAAWQSSDPVALTLRPGVERIMYSTTIVTDGIGVDKIVPIYVIDRGGGGETAWYKFDLAPDETDDAKFRRLVTEWCAARVVLGWFIIISHWGVECALGWGFNDTGEVQTARFKWATSEKLAITPVLGVPVPGAPEVV
jgi:hypothetical protein